MVASHVAGSTGRTRLHGRSRISRLTRSAVLLSLSLSLWGSAHASSPSLADSSLAETRELIRNGEYGQAIDALKAVIAQATPRADLLRDAYLLLIKAYIFAGTKYGAVADGREASLLYFKEARTRIAECLRTPGLRHTKAEPEVEYPRDMILMFAEVRAEIFGSFRVISLEPPGSSVMFDTDSLRAMPDGFHGDVDLAVGQHTVRIMYPGYAPQVDAVDIRPGATIERSYRLVKQRDRWWYASRVGIGAGAVAGLTVALWGGNRAGQVAPYEPGIARSLEVDPSIRAPAMGGTGTAVFWGDDLNDWSNPALLGISEGLRYQWGRTQLVPGLASNVIFSSQRAVIGMNGVGISVPGAPGKDGSAFLSYGAGGGTDQNGNPLGTFLSSESIRSWGAGIDFPRAFESLARAAGYEPPRFARVFDAALGFNHKQFRVDFAPNRNGASHATDFGLFTRATLRDPTETGRHTWAGRVELSYGFSVLNADGATVQLTQDPQFYPTTLIYRNGVALRTTSGTLGHGAEGARWLPAQSLEPLLSIGLTADFEHLGGFYSASRIRHYGLEVTLGNLLSLRAGSIQDQAGDIHAATFGIGAGYRYKDVAGIQYNWATYPQASGLFRVNRNGVSAFFNPLALNRRDR